MFRIKEILGNIVTEEGRKGTVVWLADKINMAQPNLNNIVNNKATPSFETLQKIADALQVYISDLFEKPQTEEISGFVKVRGEVKVIKSKKDLENILTEVNKMQ